MNLLKFIIDDLPFSVYNALEVINIGDSHLSIFFFRLELELNLKNDDLGVNEALRLLFETSIREGLLEGNSSNKEGIIDRSSSNFFNTDQVFVQKSGV